MSTIVLPWKQDLPFEQWVRLDMGWVAGPPRAMVHFMPTSPGYRLILNVTLSPPYETEMFYFSTAEAARNRADVLLTWAGFKLIDQKRGWLL